MYRSDLNPRDRSGAIAAVVAIHAALLLALLNLSGRIELTDPQRVLDVFDVTEIEPRPETEVVEQEREATAEPEEGEASPENIRSQATEIVDPRPEISLPVPVPMETTETPNQGVEATQGAADVPGPGTGAGGVGTGTGSGGSGSGTGGGGGVAVPATLVRGITTSDYPRGIRFPRNGRIFVRLRIEASGRPSQCDVMRGYGDPVADQWTCRLLMERGQFRPARNARGEPVAAWFGYVQSDTGRFTR